MAIGAYGLAAVLLQYRILSAGRRRPGGGSAGSGGGMASRDQSSLVYRASMPGRREPWIGRTDNHRVYQALATLLGCCWQGTNGNLSNLLTVK